MDDVKTARIFALEQKVEDLHIENQEQNQTNEKLKKLKTLVNMIKLDARKTKLTLDLNEESMTEQPVEVNM